MITGILSVTSTPLLQSSDTLSGLLVSSLIDFSFKALIISYAICQPSFST